ncbi:hypothetical protein ACLOJK_036808 [Asimina triloba]
MPLSSFSNSSEEENVDEIAKLINDHPFPPAPSLLESHLLHSNRLSTALLESVLGRLFSGHANGLKALELFKLALHNPHHLPPSPDSFEKTLHILARMRHFDRAWDLMREVHHKHPSLITHKAISILLSRYAKATSFEDTLQAFHAMERLLSGRRFGVEEFNILLRAFCTQKQMKEAKAVFRKLHSSFSANTQTMNILLLGFKDSGDITAVELFYHEMIVRGFKPNVITYNIRIDAYCKKGCLSDALRVVEEMEGQGLLPTLETITTLIHGASIARNPLRAGRLFDEISARNLVADTGAYNALMGSLVRSGNSKGALDLMDEMEQKGIGHDEVTYYTAFLGLKNLGVGAVCELYRRMVDKGVFPRMRTVVMLMKFFCENRRSDLGLDLWRYMVGKGCCPHGHAVDLLVTALCCGGKMEEAYNCMKQVMEQGRHPGERGFNVLESFLWRAKETEKLKKLDQMKKRLRAVLVPSRGHAICHSMAVGMA